MGFLQVITVAAANTRSADKKNADFVCTGKNDELTINEAIKVAAEEGKCLCLLNGLYSIDGFYDFGDGGPKAAICVPALYKEIAIIGQTYAFEPNREGVQLDVSAQALDMIESGEYSVLRTEWKSLGVYSGGVLRLENIIMTLAHNQKPLRCIDLRRCDRVEMKNVKLRGKTKNTYLGIPELAAVGCIGLTMTDGSNNAIVRYENVSAGDFYEAIQVGGEHVIMINCAAVHSFYGYTFGNYAYHCAYNHPITMINCCDERNVNLPLFNVCGDESREGKRLLGGQEVSMFSFNIERLAAQTPGGALGDAMRELHPGAFCGRIEYTLQPAWNHTNEANFKLFENGSGIGFRAINMVHKTVCGTSERLSYYPSLGQQIFDTDLNKLLICIDADNKKWVDANGNAVD